MMNQKNRANAHGSGLAWLRRVTAFVCTFAMLFSSCGPVLSGDTALAQYSEDYRVTSDPIYPTTPLPSLLPSATPEADPEATPIPDEYWDGQGGALTASGDGWTATLTYRTEAKIPDGAVLTLTELKGADLYNAMKSAAALLKNDADEVWRRELSNEDNHFFTASITDPDGNTVQPQAAVALTWQNTNHDSEQTYFSFGDEASRIVESADGTMHFKPYLGESFGYGATDNIQIGIVTQVHEGSDYMVTASYGPEAGFPAGTELKVREIMPGTAEYATYSGMTDEALGEDWSEITLERYFDIAFVKDGKELEPQADIDVQISFSEKIELTEEHDVAAVHIENNEATVIETETESNEAAKYDSEAIDTVAFTSDSFSVYGVVQKKRIITKVLEAGGNTYEIELSYTQEAEIPENAQLIVEEIPEGSDLWEAYRIQTAAALKADDVRLPGLYDISIVDEAGEKVKPAIPVNIAIKLLNDDTTEDIQIVHFKEEMPQELVDEAAQQAEQAVQETPSQPETQQPEEQTEQQTTEVRNQPEEPSQTIKSEQITATVEGDTVTFEAETFSVYAFAYTVDFYYGEYEYHLEGGTYMSLKNLLTILHVVEEEKVQEFVNNIADVTFSDPTLISVSKVVEDTTVGDEMNKLGLEAEYSTRLSEETIAEIQTTKIIAVDWALISLKPFFSEESLTLSMANGDKYVIRVTDAADYLYWAMVSDKNGGYINTKVGSNDVFKESGKYIYDPLYDSSGRVQNFKHKATTEGNYTIAAVANSGYNFAFWIRIKQDGSWSKYTKDTYPCYDTGYLQQGDILIAFFTPTNAKVIVRGIPDPTSAWHFTPRDKVRYAYYGMDGLQHDDVPRYNYTTDSSGTIEWQSSFDDQTTRDQYDFVGWFNQNEYISRGRDIYDGYIKHIIKLSDIKDNTILIPKYELKDEYRTYSYVWLDGSDGVTNNNGDSTTLARINGSGIREGAGQEVKVINKGDMITLPTTATISFQKPLSDTLHHYAIDGWYDITTKQFHQPGDSVRINNDTVFYASWFPANYNFANGSGAISTKDTSSFISMQLYDYNSIYNMKWLNLSSSNITSIGHSEEWTMKGDANEFIFLTTAGQLGRSINPYGRTIINSNNEAGADNEHYNAYSANIPIPGDLTNGSAPGVKSVGSANYLFRYDNTTGYYFYDSSKNKAAYGNGRFYVYNGTERAEPNYGTSDFLPFNDGQSTYHEPSGEPNYWFGMDTRINFYLPDTPGNDNANLSTMGDQMVYKFSGDDDVWVEVDGKLVLNMSGVHGLIYGEINFSTGKYTIAQGGTAKTVDAKGIMSYGSGGQVNTYDLSSISGLENFGAGEHTIRMVYLERGASQSNCAIYFNLAPKTQRLKIRKVTDYSNNTTKYVVRGAEFKIYTETDYLNGGQPINPIETKQVDDMSGYYYGQSFVSDDSGRFFWGELPTGIYYIVETKAPHGLETLTNPIRMEINDTDKKIYYGPVNPSNLTEYINKYTKPFSADTTKYLDIYVNNNIENGSIKVEKNWSASLASTESESSAILFRIERTPETDVYSNGISGGNGVGNSGNFGIYYEPEKYGLATENIYEQNGTKYIKLNKNGSTWETLNITNLPMACISTEKDEYDNYPVVSCYYRVTEAGYLTTDNTFHAIDPDVITVVYSGTNSVDDNGHTAILARKENPDTLTITNKSDFTNVEVQKTWADEAYADSVTVKLYRSVETPAPIIVSTDTTVHLKVTLNDADSKSTAVVAHINGQDINLTKNGNEYTGDAVVPKGADYVITFTGTAADGYTVTIDNDEVTVGQNDEQNFSTVGIVNAPISVAQTRNITLTINWTGDGAWSDGNIWAQVWDSAWQNNKGFNNYLSQSNTTATAFDVSTGADVVQIGGGFVYDDYEYSLSPETTYAKNGEKILIFNVPEGTENVSYTLTISKKSNGSVAEEASVYARDPWNYNPLSKWNSNTCDSNGQKFHVGDKVIVTYKNGWAGNANQTKWTGVRDVTNKQENGELTSPFTFIVSETEANIYLNFNPETEITVTINNSGNTSREMLIKPLRFRASAGDVSGTGSSVITTIALNHDETSESTVITGNEGWPDVSSMEQVGEAISLTATSGSDDGKSWYYKWENLPAVDENGYAYHYYVVEDVPANTTQVAYSRTETPGLTSTTITNTPADTPSYATFDVMKAVSGVTTDRDFYVKLKREKNSTTEWLNRTDASTWQWGAEASATEFIFKDGKTLRFTGLEIGYIYTAVEDTGTGKVEVGGYNYELSASQTSASATILDLASANPDKVTITNVYSEIPEPGTLVINKEVTSGSGDPTGTVFTFDVTFKNSDGSAYTGSVSVVDSTRTEATTETADATGKVTVTVSGIGTATISNIPAGTIYEVAETSIPDNWIQVGDPVAVSNIPADATGTADGVIAADETETVTFTNETLTAVYARKIWKQGTTEMTAWPTGKTVTFQLQYNAASEGAEANWQTMTQDAKGNAIGDASGNVQVNSLDIVEFNNLPNGRTYRVVETTVDDTPLVAVGSGYGTPAQPLTIENDIPLTSVEVTKAWSSNGSNVWPSDVASVTVGLFGDDIAITDPIDNTKQYTIPITAENDQKASFVNLPMYDTDGTVIIYSVKELRVTMTDGKDIMVTEENVLPINNQNWTVINGEVTENKATVYNSQSDKVVYVIKNWTDPYGNPITGLPGTGAVVVQLWKYDGNQIGDAKTIQPGEIVAWPLPEDANPEDRYYIVETDPKNPDFSNYFDVVYYYKDIGANARTRAEHASTARESSVHAGGTLYVDNALKKSGAQTVFHKKWVEFGRSIQGQFNNGEFYFGQLDGADTNTDPYRMKNMQLDIRFLVDIKDVKTGQYLETERVAAYDRNRTWSPNDPSLLRVWFQTDEHPAERLILQNNIMENGADLQLYYIGVGADWKWGLLENSGIGQAGDGYNGYLPLYGYYKVSDNDVRIVEYEYYFKEIYIYDGREHDGYSWNNPKDVTSEWWKINEKPTGVESLIENRPLGMPVKKIWKNGQNGNSEVMTIDQLYEFKNITVTLLAKIKNTNKQWIAQTMIMDRDSGYSDTFRNLERYVWDKEVTFVDGTTGTVTGEVEYSIKEALSDYYYADSFSATYNPHTGEMDGELINIVTNTGTIRMKKSWVDNDDGGNLAVLVKVLRAVQNENNITDVTNELIDAPEAFGLTENSFMELNGQKYLMIPVGTEGNWSIDISGLHTQVVRGSKQLYNAYYFIEEVGYVDATGTAYTVTEEMSPTYSGEKTTTRNINGQNYITAEPQKNANDIQTLIVNNRAPAPKTIEVSVQKQWKKNGVELTVPAGTTVTLALYNQADMATLISTIILNGIVDAETPTEGQESFITPNTAENYEDAAWRAKWINLPKVDQQGQPITYRVVETAVHLGDSTLTNPILIKTVYGNVDAVILNTDEDADSEIAIPTITNNVQTVDIKAIKTWPTGQTVPEGTSIKLMIGGTPIETAEDTGTGDSSPEGTNGETAIDTIPDSSITITDDVVTLPKSVEPKWEHTWTGLPKYDAEGREINYTVTETEYKIGNVYMATEDYLNAVNAAATDNHYEFSFENTLPTTERHAEKIWLDSNNSKGLRPGSITFSLSASYKDNSGADVPLVYADYGITQERTITVNNGTWPTADWTGLPEYTKDGKLISYDISEGEITYYTQTGKAETTTNTWTFTNTLNEVNLTIIKDDANNETNKLSGAVFELRRRRQASDPYQTVTDGSVTNVDNQGRFTVNQEITLTGITDGDYQIVEISAPAGYIPYSGEINFSVVNGAIQDPTVDGTVIRYDKTGTNPAIKVANVPGAELPATGGSGTLAYTLGGLVLILLAGAFWMVRKRRKA